MRGTSDSELCFTRAEGGCDDIVDCRAGQSGCNDVVVIRLGGRLD